MRHCWASVYLCTSHMQCLASYHTQIFAHQNAWPVSDHHHWMHEINSGSSLPGWEKYLQELRIFCLCKWAAIDMLTQFSQNLSMRCPSLAWNPHVRAALNSSFGHPRSFADLLKGIVYLNSDDYSNPRSPTRDVTLEGVVTIGGILEVVGWVDKCWKLPTGITATVVEIELPMSWAKQT